MEKDEEGQRRRKRLGEVLFSKLHFMNWKNLRA